MRRAKVVSSRRRCLKSKLHEEVSGVRLCAVAEVVSNVIGAKAQGDLLLNHPEGRHFRIDGADFRSYRRPVANIYAVM